MKKMILLAAMAIVFLAGQSATAEAGVLESVATAVGKGIARSMGQANGVINVTTTTKDSKIEGKNVDIGVVEMGNGGNLNGIVNVTTVGGKFEADETSRVGVVTTD